jgi:outer membrane immunogenic protein
LNGHLQTRLAASWVQGFPNFQPLMRIHHSVHSPVRVTSPSNPAVKIQSEGLIMRRILSAIAATAFLSSAAFAADLPVKAAAPVPVVATWTGFYLGLNGGYSFGRASFDQSATFSTIVIPTNGLLNGTGRNSVQGALFGGQIGYNWQFAGPWLFGLEADWQWADQKGGNNNCTPNASIAFFGAGANGFGYCLANEQKLTDFGTARARAGTVVHDSLWYVTGGVAWGTVKDSHVFTSTSNSVIFPFAGGAGPFAGAGSFSTTRTGWTIGGGVETKLWNNWSVKLEYLHIDLGNVTDTFALVANPVFGGAFVTGFSGATVSHTRVTDDLVRVGVNYQFSGIR